MRKIPTVFVRNPVDLAHVTRDVTPGCEWVLRGEGRATRKFDGTCVLYDKKPWGSSWFTRREVKPGRDAPPGFRLIEEDPATGKKVGWEPPYQSPFREQLAEAVYAERLLEAGWERDFLAGIINGTDIKVLRGGTYELCGPKINGNPEGLTEHRLLAHGSQSAPDTRVVSGSQAVRTFDTIRSDVLKAAEEGSEGIVYAWGLLLAKIKGKDFTDEQ